MGFLAILFGIGTAVVAAAKAVATKVRAIFHDNVHRTMDPTVKTVFEELDQVKADLSRKNTRISELEEKLRRDRKLRTSEREELEFLMERRVNDVQRWGSLSSERIARQRGDANLVPVKIDLDHSHLLEGHIGFAALNKLCPTCGRLLALRRNWQRNGSSLNSYFWSCPSYFDPHPLHGRHSHTEGLTIEDLSLLADPNEQDWQTHHQEMRRVVQLCEPAVNRRVRAHSGERIEPIICGTHGEAMILRENRFSVGLLDQYRLACARPGCEYKVKIASVGQLTTLLTAAEGRGIL